MVKREGGSIPVPALASLLVCALLLAPQGLNAQSTGTISGTVLDQASKPVTGAAIAARDVEGKVSGKAATDADGHFSTEVPSGVYSWRPRTPGSL